jgi:hypothetical protein
VSDVERFAVGDHAGGRSLTVPPGGACGSLGHVVVRSGACTILTTRRVSVVLSTLAVAVILPAAAFALRSDDGLDYSEDYNAVKNVRICDNETDGNGAYSDYQRNGSGSTDRVYDGNGSAAGCGNTSSGNKIYRHKACEDIAVLPDSCGPWVYP